MVISFRVDESAGNYGYAVPLLKSFPADDVG